MKEKKNDRRVRYTIMVIRQSFVKLLKTKPIAKITIKEICEEADINRATFYAHYQDQYDLLQQIEDDIIDNINQYLGSYDLRNAHEVPVEMLDKILEYIKENSEIFDVLLNSSGDIKFQQEVTNIIGRQHFALQTAKEDDAEYVYLFYANGCIGVILKWLKDGMKKPVKEITELILGLSSNGVENFKGC
ncbi:TetR/AcrR family transcriptional regulator [Anaerocolumna xylanovorans]|uniref:Transcriptional regulator, TetR family n=1 Tax=Anaerocolumna xylanovorans DSM 12503 TaxID=1121345 RepID=A0A1M7XWN9_9FIRM|nr:TetR-like C-terminal domain-containing protein [Anaerocolumna xylanovorans]SHO43200.1 transcriptional regulator, TetR family [Anaerocolumna xylanovorans DSM 12503]